MVIPTCFTHPDTLSRSSTSRQWPLSLITSIYQTHLFNSPTYLTFTWSKTLNSHSLTLNSSISFSITISLNPSTFSFFRNKPGSKSINLTHPYCQRLKLYWDFTRARFAHNSAEPDSCFYIAIICNAKLEFFLGDLQTEFFTRRKTSGLILSRQVVVDPTLSSRREHVFGRKSYVSTAEFLGSKHEIEIQCHSGALILKIDDEISLVVTRLAWKFRGNEKILVGGVEVEFIWDVFNWVRNKNNNNDDGGGGGGDGHGVFMFQVGDGGVWPEMVGIEKRLMRSSTLGQSQTVMPAVVTRSPSCSSVLQWAEDSDCGRSSCSSSTTRSTCGSNIGGFSLLLYAWRKY